MQQLIEDPCPRAPDHMHLPVVEAIAERDEAGNPQVTYQRRCFYCHEEIT